MRKSSSCYHILMLRIRIVRKLLMNFYSHILNVSFCTYFFLMYFLFFPSARPLTNHSSYQHQLIDNGLLEKLAILSSTTTDLVIKVYFSHRFLSRIYLSHFSHLFWIVMHLAEIHRSCYTCNDSSIDKYERSDACKRIRKSTPLWCHCFLSIRLVSLLLLVSFFFWICLT